jgi:hypothetical protein
MTNEFFKKLEEDELYKAALEKASNDDERAKIRAHARKMLSSFLQIAEQIKAEQQLED